MSDAILLSTTFNKFCFYEFFVDQPNCLRNELNNRLNRKKSIKIFTETPVEKWFRAICRRTRSTPLYNPWWVLKNSDRASQ